MQRKRLPDVLHIGYSKSMSTTLQKMFQNSPEVGCAIKTEYFPLYREKYKSGSALYETEFEKKCDNINARILIESDEHLIVPTLDRQRQVNCANITDIEKVLVRIKETLGSPKIIVVFRNQTDMFVSKYVQYIRGGGACSPQAFFDWLLSEETRINGYKYANVAEMLFDYFGSDKTYFVPLEGFRVNRQFQLPALERFLDCSGLELPSAANTSPPERSILLQAKINNFLVEQKKGVDTPVRCRHLPANGWKFLRNSNEALGRILFRTNPDLIRGSGLDRRVRSLFGENNRRLGAVLGMRMDELGYLV